jgi:hypothetical protein
MDRATASAVAAASPVTITVFTPKPRSSDSRVAGAPSGAAA